MQIKNNAVLISGGGSGMGAETARQMASQGARVAILYINLEAAQAVATEIGGIALACDITSAEETSQAIEQAADKYGAARICINCAGIGPAKRIVGREGPMPLEDFNRVIQVNLVGTFNLMRLAAAGMTTADPLGESGERGVIINTASIAAYEGQIGQAAYSASKGGIVALTLPAAREFAQFGVRVVTIAPGLVATPMLLGMPQEVQDALGATVPFPKRLAGAHEFAGLVQHVIENEYINGEVIRMDGALRLEPK